MKFKNFIAALVAVSMVLSFGILVSAQSEFIEVDTNSVVVVTVDTSLDLAGYDNVWWTGERYIWVNLSSNSATDFPALVAPHPENDPALPGGLGVSIEQDQQLHYFNEDNTPGNVEVTLGTVDQIGKTFTITGAPSGTFSRISANVDPDGWPAPEAEFNIGAAQPISVTVDGEEVELTGDNEIVIAWTGEAQTEETATEQEDATETPAEQETEETQEPDDTEESSTMSPVEEVEEDDDSDNMVLIVVAIIIIAAIVIAGIAIAKKKK